MPSRAEACHSPVEPLLPLIAEAQNLYSVATAVAALHFADQMIDMDPGAAVDMRGKFVGKDKNIHGDTFVFFYGLDIVFNFVIRIYLHLNCESVIVEKGETPINRLVKRVNLDNEFICDFIQYVYDVGIGKRCALYPLTISLISSLTVDTLEIKPETSPAGNTPASRSPLSQDSSTA